jgi:hypothetical protein
MDNTEIKLLFNYLESNREQLSQLQNEFVVSLRKQYKWTGIITPAQIESLENIKERIFAPVEWV